MDYVTFCIPIVAVKPQFSKVKLDPEHGEELFPD